MSAFVLILLGATAVFVSGTQPNLNVPDGFGPEKPVQNAKGTDDSRNFRLVPWNCYAVQNGNKCSCTILDKNWVMARTACINPNEGNQVKVYAGAENDKYAEQIRNATIFSASEPSPQGVLFLQLNNSLYQTNAVRWVNLTADEVDNVFGYVSGYHYHNFQGNETYYQSEIHGAHIIDKACRGPKEICGIEYHNGAWPPLSNDKSKVTDFLDYYNKTTGKVYVLGVLEEHYTEEVAVYHKVKDMLPWIEKHLGIPVPKALRGHEEH